LKIVRELEQSPPNEWFTYNIWHLSQGDGKDFFGHFAIFHMKNLHYRHPCEGDLFFDPFSYLTENQGIAPVQERAEDRTGQPKGPGKSRLDSFRPEIVGLLMNGTTQKFIAQRYHTTEANLHNWIKKAWIEDSQSHYIG
jgi:hypothetical protein